MKVAIVKRFNKPVKKYTKELVRHDMEFSLHNPDIVITIGGDGTLLGAERKWPGVLKLPIKESQICAVCEQGDLGTMFRQLKKKRFKVEKHRKIHAVINGKTLWATNDFIIRNKRIQEALRFDITVNGRKLGETIIGDGIVVSTSFGSTGYYKSISYTSFKKGWAVAFNNPTKRMQSLILGKDTVVFTLLRGQGLLAMDNDDTVIQVKKKVTFRLAKETTNIIRFK